MAVDVGPGTAPPAYLYGEDLRKVIEMSAANGEKRDADGRDPVVNLRRRCTAAASQTMADLTSRSTRELRKSSSKIVRAPRAPEEHTQAPEPGEDECGNTANRRRGTLGAGKSTADTLATAVATRGWRRRRRHRRARPGANIALGRLGGRGRRWSPPGRREASDNLW